MVWLLILVGVFYLIGYLVIRFATQTVLQRTSKEIINKFELVTGTLQLKTTAYKVYKENPHPDIEVFYYVYYNLLELPYPFLGYRSPITKITKAVFVNTPENEDGKTGFKVLIRELSIFNHKNFLTTYE